MVETVGGLLTQSLALLADAAHMLTDVGGLGINIAGVRMLRHGSGDSLNVRGAYLELLSDLVSSIGVIVAAVIISTTGWLLADPLRSAGIALFIIPRTWRLLREAGSVLLEGTPADVDLARVRATLLAIDGVLDVPDLHAWSLTSGVHAMSVHVVRRADANAEVILAHVQRMVPATPQSAVTVQIEPDGWDEGETHL